MSLPSNFLTATESIALAKKGERSITSIVQDHLARYQDRNGTVKAWAYYDQDKILKDAKALDALPETQRGPMFGAMVGIKDIIYTKDMPTQEGSEAYADHFVAIDAPIVHLMRNAGALIIGKTHTTEFAALADCPPTRNPYDTSRSPGGSSSGSAAAVRDFQCHISVGSQTGGSTVRPASFCGIYGFKPTWGSVSREGLKIGTLTLDTPGFFARSIADLDLICDVFRLMDDIPPSIHIKPLSLCRFGYLKTSTWSDSPPEASELHKAWSKSRQILQDAGATIVDIDLDLEFRNIQSYVTAIGDAEFQVNFLSEYQDPEHRKLLGRSTVDKVENVKGITHRQYVEALDSAALLRPKIDRLAREFDAVITPSCPGEAPMNAKSTGDPRFNSMWTLLHVPVINIPGFAGDTGLPIGMTLVAPRYEDQKLLVVSRAVAEVWKDAESAKLKTIPAPPNVKFLQID